MNKNEKLVLIDGEFSQEDAKEILLNLFSSKIHFHNLKNLSSQERFGKDDQISQKRIVKLNREIEKIQTIFSDARTNNKKFLVSSEIKITILDE